jgi:hypothetical protein
VEPAPDPNGWFHARIVVSKRKVEVFVNGESKPCLTASELSNRRGGLIGFWVGNNSGRGVCQPEGGRRPLARGPCDDARAVVTSRFVSATIWKLHLVAPE